MTDGAHWQHAPARGRLAAKATGFPAVLLTVALSAGQGAHAQYAHTDPTARSESIIVAQAPQPPGDDKSAKTSVLEAGAKLLQRTSPLGPMDIHLVGFHPLKDDPEHQMEAHHFCHQVNEDFAQCVLFDGDSKGANLNGIEYIISEKLFEGLPEQEKSFWHPHNSEILSGELMAPGIPTIAEKELMKNKINSYGKTWHVWNTGMPGHPADQIPMGPARLAWSFNRDGELHPELLEQRDRKLKVDTTKTREDRADLQSLAKPQSGVDVLEGKFSRPTSPIPGVVDKKAAPR